NQSPLDRRVVRRALLRAYPTSDSTLDLLPAMEYDTAARRRATAGRCGWRRGGEGGGGVCRPSGACRTTCGIGSPCWGGALPERARVHRNRRNERRPVMGHVVGAKAAPISEGFASTVGSRPECRRPAALATQSPPTERTPIVAPGADTLRGSTFAPTWPR